MKPLTPFFFVLSLALGIGLACNLFPVTVSAPTLEPSPMSPTSPSRAPTAVEPSKVVTTLDQLRNAVVQIEAVGTFVDPEYGLVVNAAGRGSGFLIDPAGIAVTNNHVVTGAATLKVFLNGQEYSAKVLGASECADLAVIQIDGSDFNYLEWYNEEPRTGLEVYAAGFPLGEPEFTLTKGIISKEKAAGQTFWASLDHVLGHDATINPGNSGGPLVTAGAKIVGVNYRGRPDYNQYFAIDAQTAQRFLADLRQGKDVLSIGINGMAVSSPEGDLSGIWVMSVKSGSPADRAGVQAGDLLYQMEGLVLATDGTMKDYCDILRSRNPTDTMSLRVIRFATNEILEGQLNGRPLAVVETFGSTGSSTGEGAGTAGGEQGPYFTQEFDRDPQWTFNVIKGMSSSNPNKAKYSFNNGRMVFDITDRHLYAYYFYKGFRYEDVRLDLLVENRGVNTQQVSLICHANEESWYEWAVQSDGLWYLFFYENGRYQRIANGGSRAIKMGKDTNQYTFICKGNVLSFFINGVEPKGSPVVERRFALRQGFVGFAISSLNVTPVKIEVDWLQISQP